MMSEAQQRRQMEYIPLADLELTELRDIREHIVDDIAERIEEDEYNPSRPLRVVSNGDGYKVVDGNHRVKALRQLDSVKTGKSIPCVVEPRDADIHRLAHKSNKDEDTYAEEDLFDHLDYIEGLRDDHTQQEIAEKLAWSRDKVAKRTRLLNEIVPGVLEIAKKHQEGRGTENVPTGTFGEYWFRTSDLYDLDHDGTTEYARPDEDEPKHAQVRVMEWFCEEKGCDATKNAVQNKVAEILRKCELLDTVDERLEPSVSEAKQQEIRDEVIQGVYTKDTIDSPIENANRDAKNRAVYGKDTRDVLPELESDSVDCVITDPPYGIDFENIRPTDNPSFDDSGENAFALLDTVLEELARVCKANAHIYLFFSMTEYERVKDIAGQYFTVDPTPLIWVKNNHTPSAPGNGGFDKDYAQQYEPVLWCKMPNADQRELNGGVSPNILEHAKPGPEERYHQTQKPRSLLKELIQNSTGKGERILDPFAGSGSTLLAAKELERHYVGVEVDETLETDFRRELTEVEQNG
jgi:DNA modification methylase